MTSRSKVEHYLKWSRERQQGRTSWFSSPGHPGRTNRQNTVAELEYLRDLPVPVLQLARLNRLEVLYNIVGRPRERGEQAAGEGRPVRRAEQPQGPMIGGLGKGCSTRRSWPGRRRTRSGSRAYIADPEADRRRRRGSKRIAKAVEEIRRKLAIANVNMLEKGPRASTATLFSIARTLAAGGGRIAEAVGRAAPRVRRCPPTDSLKFQTLLGRATFTTTWSIDQAGRFADLPRQARYGAIGPAVARRVLAGKSPRERAFRTDQAARKSRTRPFARSCSKAGKAAIDAANDPMIELARVIDTEARTFRKQFEIASGGAETAGGRRHRQGPVRPGRHRTPTRTPPSRLRLAFGHREGVHGRRQGRCPPFTTFEGLYARSKEHKNKPAVRHARPVGNAQEPPGSGSHAVQLRQHSRHHRRQLRESGH